MNKRQFQFQESMQISEECTTTEKISLKFKNLMSKGNVNER